MVASAGW